MTHSSIPRLYAKIDLIWNKSDFNSQIILCCVPLFYQALEMSFFYRNDGVIVFDSYHDIIISYQVQHLMWSLWRCQVIQKKRRQCGGRCVVHFVDRWVHINLLILTSEGCV